VRVNLIWFFSVHSQECNGFHFSTSVLVCFFKKKSGLQMDWINFAGPVWSVCFFVLGIGTFAVLLIAGERVGMVRYFP